MREIADSVVKPPLPAVVPRYGKLPDLDRIDAGADRRGAQEAGQRVTLADPHYRPHRYEPRAHVVARSAGSAASSAVSAAFG